MKLIRWQEMPNFEIYSDQLITIVNQQLRFLNTEVTNSMVNNYVKHKVMPLPMKKKYGQKHITYLILISLLKTAFSMEEIKQYFKDYPVETNYDVFCTIFEELWDKDSIFLHRPDSSSLAEQIDHLLATTVISKLRASALLKKEGKNHAAITS